jgi:hypothetical protein
MVCRGKAPLILNLGITWGGLYHPSSDETAPSAHDIVVWLGPSDILNVVSKTN